MGRALLARLLQQAGDTDVLLTTIGSRVSFYAAAGFRRLALREVPRRACAAHACRQLKARLISSLQVSAVGLHACPLPAILHLTSPSCGCRSLLFEVVAGTAVARLAAGEELVVLKREGR